MDYDDFEEENLQIGPFLFKMTCIAFPEQYDVLYKGEPCAYVRLRHGKLRCDVPNCGGETVCSVHFDNEIGAFPGLKEKMFYLEKIAAVLMTKLGLA